MNEHEESAGAMANAGEQAASALGGVAGRFAELVENLSRVASASACVGEPRSQNGHTVVPVATVNVQAGFGVGFGGGSGGAGNEQGAGSGGGGGGGGRAASRTIAVIDVSDAGVSVKPVVDVTRLAAALLAIIGIKLLTGRGGAGGGIAKYGLMGMLRSHD